MNIIELRKNKKISQIKAADIVGISRRGYQNIEYKLNINSRSYKFAYDALMNYVVIDEEHGILALNDIKSIVKKTLEKYDVEYAYLFGSYARNEAKEDSDIDLFISTSLKGLSFYGLIEELRNSLHKKVDLIRNDTIKAADKLVQDILREGIKIYEKK